MIVVKEHLKLLQRTEGNNSLILQTDKGSSDGNKTGFLLRSSKPETIGDYSTQWISDFSKEVNKSILTEKEINMIIHLANKVDIAYRPLILAFVGVAQDSSCVSNGSRVLLNGSLMFNMNEVRFIDYDGIIVTITFVDGIKKHAYVDDPTKLKLNDLYFGNYGGTITIKE